MKNAKNINCEVINNAYKIAAQVVRQYGDVYLPIFLRLHEEIDKNNSTTKMKSLALKIAAE